MAGGQNAGAKENAVGLKMEDWAFDNVLVVVEWWQSLTSADLEPRPGPRAKAWALLRDFGEACDEDKWGAQLLACMGASTLEGRKEVAENVALEAMKRAQEAHHLAGGALIFCALKAFEGEGIPVVDIYLSCPADQSVSQASARAAQTVFAGLPESGWWSESMGAEPKMPNELARLRALRAAREIAAAALAPEREHPAEQGRL